jgi:hypothetical protein
MVVLNVDLKNGDITSPAVKNWRVNFKVEPDPKGLLVTRGIYIQVYLDNLGT